MDTSPRCRACETSMGNLTAHIGGCIRDDDEEYYTVGAVPASPRFEPARVTAFLRTAEEQALAEQLAATTALKERIKALEHTVAALEDRLINHAAQAMRDQAHHISVGVSLHATMVAASTKRGRRAAWEAAFVAHSMPPDCNCQCGTDRSACAHCLIDMLPVVLPPDAKKRQ